MNSLSKVKPTHHDKVSKIVWEKQGYDDPLQVEKPGVKFPTGYRSDSQWGNEGVKDR